VPCGNTPCVSFVIKRRLSLTKAMNSKTLLTVPAAIALGAPTNANAYVGFGIRMAVPLYYPAPVRPSSTRPPPKRSLSR